MKALPVDAAGIPAAQSASRHLMAEIVALLTQADPAAAVCYDFLAADVIVVGADAAQIGAWLDRGAAPR